MDLNHIHFRSKDVNLSRLFYEKYFEFKELAWHGDILFLRNEYGFDLALAPSDIPDKFPGWFHIGFRLNSGREVSELYMKMKSEGVNIANELAETDNFVFFRCRDNDNNLIEVYWE